MKTIHLGGTIIFGPDKCVHSTHANCFRHLNIAGDNYWIGPLEAAIAP